MRRSAPLDPSNTANRLTCVRSAREPSVRLHERRVSAIGNRFGVCRRGDGGGGGSDGVRGRQNLSQRTGARDVSNTSTVAHSQLASFGSLSSPFSLKVAALLRQVVTIINDHAPNLTVLTCLSSSSHG